MDGYTFFPKVIHLVRIDPGEDVLEKLIIFLEMKRIQQAVVLGGYGTLVSYSLHWVTHNQLPSQNCFAQGEGGTEILGMNGLVINFRPHIHVTLATPKGAYGGHMEPGCRAYVLCEIFLAELEGPELFRESVWVDIPGMGSGRVNRLTVRESSC